MPWCLSKRATDSFLEMLKDNKIKPDELTEMSSKGRRAFFAKSFGEENSKQINALFESKLLLKNQKQGMITWAKKTAGLTEPARRDIISRINRMEKFLDPKEEQAFLEDLASQKLGLDVTQEEAKKIFDLAKNADDLRLKSLDESLSEVAKKQAEIDYGMSLIKFAEYKNSIKPVEHRVKNFFVDIANLPKTLMSTFDVSMYFRQGWGVMSTKEFWKNFPEGLRFFLSEGSYQKSLASILGHPNFEKATRAKLGITRFGKKLSQREEAFQSSLLDKLPIFRGSQRAFIGFLNKVRFDRFNSLIKKAELAGEDVKIGSQALDDIAQVVNNFSGRGSLGKKDKFGNVAPVLNIVLWSPRKITAHIAMMNPATYLKGSKTARKAALRQLIGSLAMTISALAFAKMMGADVETDPTSSDTGKAKINNSRIDFTGGNSVYLVFLARLLTGTTKSSTTGKVYTLGQGYKPTTRLTLLSRFARNKLSPIASFMANMLSGIDYKGDPIDVGEEVKERMRPLIISQIIEMAESGEELDNIAILTLFELFGFGVQTYD